MSPFSGVVRMRRLSDLTEVARHLKGRKVKSGVKAIVVPGSQGVSQIAEKMGTGGNLPRSRIRMARRGLLDVPGHESRTSLSATSFAPAQATATSKAVREARQGALSS